jgi:hypothetical protein
MRPGAVWPIAVLSLAVASGAPEAAVKRSSCPATISAADPALQRTYAEFKRSVESSPLARRLGRAMSCEARADGGAIQLTYESSTGARLVARRDPAMESTEQRWIGKGMTREAAVALLKRTERWAFGDTGCAVAWTKPPEDGAAAGGGRRELVYRGDACNCQARLVYDGTALTEVAFLSAC